MTLQEAIKSGKRFRRKSWLSLSFFNHRFFLTWEDKTSAPTGPCSGSHLITKEDILADDWEIEK